MKVISLGKSITMGLDSKTTRRFECKLCGCIFEAGLMEFWTDEGRSDYASCPNCHRICRADYDYTVPDCKKLEKEGRLVVLGDDYPV